jgi:hypothetical protein
VETFRRHARNADGTDPLALVQYLDLKTYLIGDINTKVGAVHAGTLPPSSWKRAA